MCGIQTKKFSFQRHTWPECVLKSEILSQIQTLLFGFRHLICRKTKHTKFMISDILAYRCSDIRYLLYKLMEIQALIAPFTKERTFYNWKFVYSKHLKRFALSLGRHEFESCIFWHELKFSKNFFSNRYFQYLPQICSNLCYF